METTCPFCQILHGNEPGQIIAHDEQKQFALIRDIHPEGAVHWIALPYEHVAGTEIFKQTNPRRFVELMDFAIENAKAQRDQYPELTPGFTIKIHFGAYETVPHAKLHIVSME